MRGGRALHVHLFSLLRFLFFQNSGLHSMESVPKSVPRLIRVSPHHRDLRRFKTGSFSTKPADLLLQQSVLFCLFTALRSGFLDQTGILTAVFCFGLCDNSEERRSGNLSL